MTKFHWLLLPNFALWATLFSPVRCGYYPFPAADGPRQVIYGSPIPYEIFSGASSGEWELDFLGLGLNVLFWAAVFRFPLTLLAPALRRFRKLTAALTVLFGAITLYLCVAALPVVFRYVNVGKFVTQIAFGRKIGEQRWQGICLSFHEDYYLSEGSQFPFCRR